MKSAWFLGVSLCLAAAVWADGGEPVDLTYPQPSEFVPPNNPTGVSAAQAASARIQAVGTSLQYAALCLDGDGVDQIYVKAQQQTSNGNFSNIGFYRGEGSGGWPNMTGGGAFFALDTQFSAADMRVEHDGFGNVKLTFSNLDPPSPDQVFERGGWAPRNGDEIGIAGYTGASAIDDFSITVDDLCDDFNRSDGDLGPDWVLKGGAAGVIRGGRAFVGQSNVRARFTFVGQCGGPSCNYRIKKSKAKAGCESCPQPGEEARSGVECEDKNDCEKKLKGAIGCPGGGNGICKIKGKRTTCG